MKMSSAETLVRILDRQYAPEVRVFIEKGRVVFQGATGTHSLDVRASTFARVFSHFKGFRAARAQTL